MTTYIPTRCAFCGHITKNGNRVLVSCYESDGIKYYHWACHPENPDSDYHTPPVMADALR